jgi:hypothetical protein
VANIFTTRFPEPRRMHRASRLGRGHTKTRGSHWGGAHRRQRALRCATGNEVVGGAPGQILREEEGLRGVPQQRKEGRSSRRISSLKRADPRWRTRRTTALVGERRWRWLHELLLGTRDFTGLSMRQGRA